MKVLITTAVLALVFASNPAPGQPMQFSTEKERSDRAYSDVELTFKVQMFIAVFDSVFREPLEAKLAVDESAALSDFVERQRESGAIDSESYLDTMLTVCNESLGRSDQFKADRHYNISQAYYLTKANQLRASLGALSEHTQQQLSVIIDNDLSETGKGLVIHQVDLSKEDERLEFLNSFETECESLRSGNPSTVPGIFGDESDE